MSNFMKIRPVGAELFHAYRRTDMTKLTVAFHNFANALKNGNDFSCSCHEVIQEEQKYSPTHSYSRP